MRVCILEIWFSPLEASVGINGAISAPYLAPSPQPSRLGAWPPAAMLELGRDWAPACTVPGGKGVLGSGRMKDLRASVVILGTSNFPFLCSSLRHQQEFV